MLLPLAMNASAVATVAALMTGPRERASELGIEALGEDDLVALMLGTGRAGESVSVLAARLLEDSGGLIGLSRRGLGGSRRWKALVR